MEKNQAPPASERIVALNATGGNDHGAVVLVDGAIAAMKNGARVVLVGDPEQLSPLLYERACPMRVLSGKDADRDALKAMQYLEVPVLPGKTVKRVAEFVGDGFADAIASGGRTRRLMGTVARRIGVAQNVSLPAFIAEAPRLSLVPQIVLDVGGRPDDSVRAFIDRAFLGQAAAKALGIENPTIGLINMGKEDQAGTEAKNKTRAALQQCADAGLLRFVGNVEGDDIFGMLGGDDDAPDAVDADVILMDAPEGNEMLKLTKKFAKLVKIILKTQVFNGLRGSVAGALVHSRLAEAFSPFRSDLQSSLAVGLRKPVVVYHGSSREGAVEHAIYRAARPPIDLSEASAKIAQSCALLGLPLYPPKKNGEQED